MSQPEQYFDLRDGRCIVDESLAGKMYIIKSFHPELHHTEDTGFDRNEIGMANLFMEVYAEEARYCPEKKSWYAYSDGVWHKDEGSLLVSEMLKDFYRLLVIYCGEIVDENLRKKFLEFVARLGDRRMRDRILKDAASEMTIHAEEFDSNPYLINCKNGTFDLQKLIFRKPRWDDFLTMQTNFSHTVRRDISCPRWEQFIDEVTEGDKDKADFLQRALGYSLLGIASEECMFILHGKTTRNGKSTLLNTIEHLLGDYSRVAPVALICGKKQSAGGEGVTSNLAALKGKRFVTMAESNEYGKLDEEKLKQYTGGEKIAAREIYEKAITFLPQFTLWLSCNDLPSVTDKSIFASERIKVIEFNRHFSASEQDKTLKTELTTQEAMSGIFAWLVKGYVEYTKRGLEMSDSLKRIIRQYEKDNDVIEMFLEQRCESGEGLRIKVKDLYSTYRTWAKSNGYSLISNYKFKNELMRHPKSFDWIGLTDGYPVVHGLALRSDYD